MEPLRPHLPAILGLLVLALMTNSSLAQDDKEAWGKRIWDRKIDDEHRIVVDERGVPSGTPQEGKVLRAPVYCWRLLKTGDEDGPVLFRCLGYNAASGVGPALEPIEVLYVDLINGDLVTVFNKREAFLRRDRCWACIVHRKPDGGFDERPLPYDRPQPPKTTGLVDNSVGPAMKSAAVEKQPDGTLLLTVTDDQKRSFGYQLRSWEYDKHAIYYWASVAAPKTAEAK